MVDLDLTEAPCVDLDRLRLRVPMAGVEIVDDDSGWAEWDALKEAEDSVWSSD